jgi:uncharacterized damage-inducible protein DinB
MQASDLVRYNDAVRTLYLEAMAKLPWSEVVKSRGASFDSIRGVFLHLTLVEDRWISYTLVERFSEWKDPNFEAFQDAESLKQYVLRVHGNTERYLQNLKPEDAQRLVTVPWGKTPDTQITVETALTHMVMECMVHFGELSDLMWQIDAEPPYFAYWRYKYNKEAENSKQKPSLL